MRLTDRDAGASKTTLCKHAGRSTQCVGNNEREVLRVVFHANVGDIRVEPEWEVDVGAHLAHTISFCLSGSGEILLHPFQSLFHRLAILVGVASQLDEEG